MSANVSINEQEQLAQQQQLTKPIKRRTVQMY